MSQGVRRKAYPHSFLTNPPIHMSETQTRGQLLNAAVKAINPSDVGSVLKDLARYTRRISKSTSVPDPDNPGQRKILDKELTPPEFITDIDDETFTKFHDKLKSCAGNPSKFKDVFCLDGDSEPAAEPAEKVNTPAPAAPKAKAPAKKAAVTSSDADLLTALTGFVQSCIPEPEGGDAAPEGMEARVAELEKVRANTKTFLLNLKSKIETLEAKVTALEGGPAATGDDGL